MGIRTGGHKSDDFDSAAYREGSRDDRKYNRSMVFFGHPGDPNDETSTKLAGDNVAPGAHNGALDKIGGSWVEVELTANDTVDVPCNHNLYLHNPRYAVPVAGSPNVRWSVWGWQHDGNGYVPPVVLSVFFDSSAVGAVASNTILLTFSVSGLTPHADHPMKVTLFFIEAIQ